eukprot:9116045-Heterocapsa_arctica.AAC.1
MHRSTFLTSSHDSYGRLLIAPTASSAEPRHELLVGIPKVFNRTPPSRRSTNPSSRSSSSRLTFLPPHAAFTLDVDQILSRC